MLGRIQYDEDESEWVTCPYCGKKNLKINSKTVIHNLSLKCKGSNCKKEFNVCIPERSWSNAEEI